MPRYLLLLHGDQDSEAGKLPSKDVLAQMHAYNAEIKAAGALLGAEGLHATSEGARVVFPPGDPSQPCTEPAPKSDITVTNGPFEYPDMRSPEGRSGPAERPVCGFWIIKARDLEDAVGWVKKSPLKGTFVEVRRIFEREDFGECK